MQVAFPRSGPVYLMGSYYDPPMLQARRRAISFTALFRACQRPGSVLGHPFGRSLLRPAIACAAW